jgi:protoporphyrinogen IX oxidase
MPWLKLLHIAAVIVWCGTLLYLPAAIAAAGQGTRAGHRHALVRGLFTTVATPAALVAVVAGTGVFVLQGPLAPWLIAKLSLVGLLVLGHAACGLLILRIEHGKARRGADRGKCIALGGLMLLWLLGIAWLVLRKPLLLS